MLILYHKLIYMFLVNFVYKDKSPPIAFYWLQIRENPVTIEVSGLSPGSGTRIRNRIHRIFWHFSVMPYLEFAFIKAFTVSLRL